METYTSLLKEAVKAIVKKEEQDDLVSIFQKGSQALFGKNITGLDDFELITFLVIK
jgi:hypothetical protein